MSSITVSTHTSAPVEQVFAVYTDLAKAVERIPGIIAIELLSEGPFGKGKCWRETRVICKKEVSRLS